MPCAGANGLDGTRCMSDEPIAKVVVPSEALMAGRDAFFALSINGL